MGGPLEDAVGTERVQVRMNVERAAEKLRTAKVAALGQDVSYCYVLRNAFETRYF
jgi:hypothetical protein